MPPKLKPGLVLRDKWRLDSFLGRGGMSSVWAATHRNGMRGAIKVLHQELTTNDVVKKRFLREGYVANKVEHPGAVKVLDDDATEDGLVFLVMELLEGVTLKQRWIELDRRLDPSLTMDVLDQVLGVLESAHDRKIVHRDLKPDNVFMVANGGVKVLDFGIARVLEAALPGSADATSSAAMMGTPAFMPPEQALAHWSEVDGRSDLYALAATAFTVLTGRLVHTGSTIPELLIAAATRPADKIQSVMPDLDDAIAEVIDRALSFDIKDRWPDARAMRLALLQAKTKAAGSRTIKLPAQLPVIGVQPPARPPPHARTDTVAPATDRIAPTPTLADAPATSPDLDATVVRPTEVTFATPLSTPKPSELDTPVRMQQPMRPEHVVRLAGTQRLSPQATSTRSSGRAVAWLAGGVIAATAIAAGVYLFARSDRPRKDAPVAGAPATSAAPAQSTPSPLASTPEPGVVQAATATGAQTSATATGAQTPASATSQPAVTSPRPPPPPRAPPPPAPKTCVRFSEFDGRCVEMR